MHETTSTFTQTNKQTKIEKRWKTNPLSSHVLNFDVKVRSICVKMFLFSLRYCREEKKRRSWVLVRCVEVSSYALLHTDIILWSTYVRLTDTNTHTLTHSHTHTHIHTHTHKPTHTQTHTHTHTHSHILTYRHTHTQTHTHTHAL